MSLRPTILLIPGFGDGAEMFAPLAGTSLAERYRLHAVDLPGFAGTPPLDRPTTLEALAGVVHQIAVAQRARIAVAHSLASVIAAMAARRPGSPVDTILSLEGNLTAADAYFSGTAADFPDPWSFRTSFLARLDRMVRERPIVARYRRMVARADPQALWELGCDARRMSRAGDPGEDLLRAVGRVRYFYNPANCPPESIEWLGRNPIRTVCMDGASHWKSVDQPEALGEKLLAALAEP